MYIYICIYYNTRIQYFSMFFSLLSPFLFWQEIHITLGSSTKDTHRPRKVMQATENPEWNESLVV